MVQGCFQGMPYSFAYDVNDRQGSDYAHQERSDGSVVSGQYRVLLPDGRVQIVTYTADHENGYQATVEYQGEAVFPDPVPRAQRRPSGAYSASAPQSQPAPAAPSLPRYGIQK